jgi:hypothetical protein
MASRSVGYQRTSRMQYLLKPPAILKTAIGPRLVHRHCLTLGSHRTRQTEQQASCSDDDARRQGNTLIATAQADHAPELAVPFQDRRAHAGPWEPTWEPPGRTLCTRVVPTATPSAEKDFAELPADSANNQAAAVRRCRQVVLPSAPLI